LKTETFADKSEDNAGLIRGQNRERWLTEAAIVANKQSIYALYSIGQW
jgi:hypothetical protein